MKKFLSAVCIAATCIICLLAMTACTENNEEQEILPAETVHITTAAQLAEINDYTGVKYKNYTFELDNDVDLSGIDIWTPIGDTTTNAFYGTFNGNGHTVSNLSVKGWDASGNPLYVGKDKGLESETSFSSVALFGYTNGATVRGLNLSVDIYYYVDTGYAYSAGLVGYNVGSSVFEDITVSGDIKISNVYLKNRTYDNRGEFQNIVDVCETTLYVGGVIGYSHGNSTFTNIASSVNIDNEYYCAYYQTADTFAPDEEVTEVEEKYVVDNSGTYANTKIEQVFAGGVVAYLKNGVLSNASYTGDVNISAKSIYSAGIAAATYSAEIEGATAEDVDLFTKAFNKNVSGGIAALADDSVIENATVDGAEITVSKLASVQTISAGGIFGYACNLSEITDASVAGLTIYSSLETANVGGIGGVLRNASAENCTAVESRFVLDEFGISESNYTTYYKTYAIAVGSVYGNSVLRGNEGSALVSVAGSYKAVNQVYASSTEISYVNEEGGLAIRLYQKGSDSIFLLVDATIDGNSLLVSVYNEELTSLASLVYSREGGYEDATNCAEAYLDVYFAEGTGIVNSDGEAVRLDGRDLTQYEYRSGRPVIENNTILNIE